MPNHTGVYNVPIAYIDIDSIEDDTNNNDRLDEERKRSSEPNVDNCDGKFDDSLSFKMTKLHVNERLVTKRPTSIGLKSISEIPTEPGQLDVDQPDGCFGAQEESEHDCAKGINIKFQDVIYRARSALPWDRCKCKFY